MFPGDLSFYRRQFVNAGLAVVAMLFLSLPVVRAAFILGSTDAAGDYPSVAEAMFRTADPVTTTVPNLNTRGVRFDRIQSQTFKAAKTFTVESIYIGYQWNGIGAPQDWPINFRLIEVDDIGVVYDRTTVTSLSGPAFSATVIAPQGTPTNAFLTLRLDWTGAPIVIGPRNGQEGYAIEFVGTGSVGGETPIGIVAKTDNPAADSRAIEFNTTSGLQTLNANNDFVVAIRGRIVPEPSAAILLVLGMAGIAARRWRVEKVA